MTAYHRHQFVLAIMGCLMLVYASVLSVKDAYEGGSLAKAIVYIILTIYVNIMFARHIGKLISVYGPISKWGWGKSDRHNLN